MIRFSRLSLLACSTAVLLCAPAWAENTAAAAVTKSETAKKPAKASDPVVVKVNGDAITKSQLDASWSALFPEGKAPDFDKLDPAMKQNVMRGLASEHLVYKEAEAAGVNNSPEVAKKLADLKQKMVTQVYLEQKGKALVSDDDVKKAYDKMAAEQKGKEEVQARHILVDTEDKAEEIEKQLKDGKDFGEIAKKMSMDSSNAAKGGDLGWFGEGQMVPEFSKAAFALKKGEVSKPVKTEFGWHVIQVTDRRAIEVPPYDQVKDNLRNQLETAALKEYVAKKIDAAKIDYFDADGKPMEAPKAVPAPAKTE